METKIFRHKIGNNSIEYLLMKEQKEAQMISSNVDDNFINMFFVILRESIDYFLENGYEKMSQIVSEKECIMVMDSNNKWKKYKNIVINENKCSIIYCKMEDAAECVSSAYGLK